MSASGVGPQDDGHRVTNIGAMGATPPLPNLDVSSRDLGNLIELDVTKLDPAFKYRLVLKNRVKVGRRRSAGYVVVDPTQEKIYHVNGDEIQPDADGTYSIADLVLMKIARKDYKLRRLAQRRRTEERMEGPKRSFKRKARRTRDRAGNYVEVITDKEPGGRRDRERSRRKSR